MNPVRFIKGVYTFEGQFAMECIDCNRNIEGTIASGDVLKVIKKNELRGGTKCPQCRAMSCDACGHLYGNALSRSVKEGLGFKVGMKVCHLCRIEDIGYQSEVGYEGINNSEIGLSATEHTPKCVGDMLICPRCTAEDDDCIRVLETDLETIFCLECLKVGDSLNFLTIPF